MPIACYSTILTKTVCIRVIWKESFFRVFFYSPKFLIFLIKLKSNVVFLIYHYAFYQFHLIRNDTLVIFRFDFVKYLLLLTLLDIHYFSVSTFASRVSYWNYLLYWRIINWACQSIVSICVMALIFMFIARLRFPLTFSVTDLVQILSKTLKNCRKLSTKYRRLQLL